MNINKAQYKHQATNLLFWLIIFLSFGVNGYSQVGIGTIAPNSKAALDISSTNKGLLIPRVTKANRPVSPPAGMMIYQTDNTPGFYFYTGAKWQRIYAVDETDPIVINPNPGASTDPAAAAGSTGTIVGADGITYKSVRLGDGSIWLQQNLGSSRVATTADDAQSFGDLYQWGRWTDGHEKRTPVFSRTISPTQPNPNNPGGLVKQWGVNVNPYYYHSSNTWWYSSSTQFNGANLTDTWEAASPSLTTTTNGCDPCRLLLGGTWRLPTQAEYFGLLNNSFITGFAISNLNTGFNSHLKLSAGGYRDRASTSIGEIGTGAYYWTSTAYSANNSQVYYLGLGANINSYSLTGDWRGFGYAIRCKKD